MPKPTKISTGKRKSEAVHAVSSSKTPRKSSAKTTTAPSVEATPKHPSLQPSYATSTFRVTGDVLWDAYLLTMEQRQQYYDKWICGKDLCSVLPDCYSNLKGKEAQIKLSIFTLKMNKMAHRLYNEKAPFNVYANRHGTTHQWYYLYTTKDECPNQPNGDDFNTTDINLIRIPPRVQAAAAAAAVTPLPPTTQHNNNNNNNNIGKKKSSEDVRNESAFEQKEIFNIFMPQDCKFEDYHNPGEAVLERLQRTMTVCRDGMMNWRTAVVDGEDNDASEWEMTNIRMKCYYLYHAIRRAINPRHGMNSNPNWTNCCQWSINLLAEMGFEYITCERTVRRWYNQICNNNFQFPHPNPQTAAGEVAIPPFFIEFPEALTAFYRHADDLADKDQLTCEAMHDFVNNILIPKLHQKHNKDLPMEEQLSKYNFLLGLNFLRRKARNDGDMGPPERDDNEAEICQRTINKWMTQLGYGWRRRIKNSYNSTHEHPLTKAYRSSFIARYFFQYEPRAFRWVQIAKSDATHMKQNNCVPHNAGIEYTTANGNEMVEFHVDDCPSFAVLMNKVNGGFGGNLSELFLNAKTTVIEDMRRSNLIDTEFGNYEYEKNGESWTEIHASQLKDPNGNLIKDLMEGEGLSFGPSVRVPLIMLGQDECIFKQYITFMHHWVKRDGQSAMSPKDDGMGLMASMFKCREFGTMRLDAAALKRVNEWRKTHRPKYCDENAATHINGSPNKPELQSTPFLVIFDYGSNAEGYWNYNRMVLQLEDMIDVLDALHSVSSAELTEEKKQHMPDVPFVDGYKRKYDYLSLFDHSCGHDKKQEDGLTTKGIRVGMSPKARKMRPSKIVKEEGYLGKYERSLQVGDTQYMVYQEDDEGPAGVPKYDVINGTREEDMTAEELSAALREKDYNYKGNKSQLLQRCISANIATKKTVPNVTQVGYVNKAKGSLRILKERGFIDPENLAQYKQKGSTDEFGNVINNTSLDYLMDQLEDFANEKTMLQHYGAKLGCIVDRTPKCTPEIAGEGVEYEWAMSKMYYRKQKMERKKTKKNFELLVRESLGTSVLTLERSRKFSRRARQYMMAYYMLEKDSKATTPVDVKNYKKERKSHTDVLKEDYRYISECLRELWSEHANHNNA